MPADWGLRWLTKNYYVFLHFWLLLVPMELCCDWSSYGIANIHGWDDPRNLSTLAMYLGLALLGSFLAASRVAPRELRNAALVGLGALAINFVPASGLLVEVSMRPS